MIHKFFPREINFFELFNQQIGYGVTAAQEFKALVAKGVFDQIALKKISAIEHQSDEVAHKIIEQLNKTFITPFDREDIHALAIEIDDIIDMITTITNRLVVYKINGINKNLVEFSKVIEESVIAVAAAVKGLNNMKNYPEVNKACVEVNRLENIGDAMRDKVLAELFETEKDFIAVIKWKEIYEDSETVLDICEDVAHVVGNIMVKQA
jgi:hypothetical protein